MFIVVVVVAELKSVVKEKCGKFFKYFGTGNGDRTKKLLNSLIGGPLR
jgi:hypothetical protein